MAKQKEIESKSVNYNTSVSDKIFTIINTLFLIAFVVITLYPVLNTLAISLNDGIDSLRGGIYLIPRKWTLQNYKTVIHKNNLINGAVVSVARTIIGTLTAPGFYRQPETLPLQKPAFPVLGGYYVCERRPDPRVPSL